MIIIINVYQRVFVLTAAQPIKFPTYYTKKLLRNTYRTRNKLNLRLIIIRCANVGTVALTFSKLRNC